MRRDVQAVEPDQRIVDFIGFEALRAELAFQLLQFGAGFAVPVMFVDKHEHIEHASI